MKALKTAVLLLGPVLVLVGTGFYLDRKAPAISKDSGPLRVKVDNFQSEPVTPYEVAQGFDTKAVVQYHWEGQSGFSGRHTANYTDLIPEKPQLVFEDGTALATDASGDTPRFTVQSHGASPQRTGSSTFLMRLRGSHLRQKVILRTGILLLVDYEVSKGRRVLHRTRYRATTNAQLKVRSTGEATVVPPISRQSFITVQSATLSPVEDNQLVLEVNFRNGGHHGPDIGMRAIGPYIRRPSGEIERKLAYGPGGAKVVPWTSFPQPEPELPNHKFHYYLDASLVDKARGGVLEIQIASGDTWPVTVKIPLSVDKRVDSMS